MNLLAVVLMKLFLYTAAIRDTTVNSYDYSCQKNCLFTVSSLIKEVK